MIVIEATVGDPGMQYTVLKASDAALTDTCYCRPCYATFQKKVSIGYTFLNPSSTDQRTGEEIIPSLSEFPTSNSSLDMQLSFPAEHPRQPKRPWKSIRTLGYG